MSLFGVNPIGILNYINGSSNVIQKLSKPIQVERVESRDDKGKLICYMDCSERITYAARLTVRVDGQGTETFKDLPNWIPLANQNRYVADAFNYLKTGNNEMTTLYKVYEIIAEDVGGLKTMRDNGWASKNKIELFTRTANSPDAIGDKARHAVQKNQPPTNPMSLNEAESFIRHLVKCWLDSKIPN